MNPEGAITDPSKFLEFPFLLMERIFTFTSMIMQESFKFATEIGRFVV